MRNYEKALKVFAERVGRELNGDIEALIVYGSVARGEATRESDIDLMVVLKGKDPELKDRVKRIRDSVVFEYGRAITLDFETDESLRKLIDYGDPFVSNVLEDGKPLIDPRGYFAELRGGRVKLYQR